MLPLPDSFIWGALALAVLLALFRQRFPPLPCWDSPCCWPCGLTE